MSYIVQSPILFLNFNRPQLTEKVFDAIKQAKPSRLYIAIDGPRTERPNDQQLVDDVKALVDKIDWPCEVKKRYNQANMGCKNAVSSAISWFFENEKEGIILEDDCVPEESFFFFCDSMLEKYRHDDKVGLITGTNLQRGQVRGSGSYYFSRYSNIWGWAAWKRTWEPYDPSLAAFEEQEAEYHLRNIFNDDLLVKEWMNIFRRLKAGEIDTWDYQFTFLNLFTSRLCITPNKNLISNIGFRVEPTHYNANLHNSELPVHKIDSIVHPSFMVPDTLADHYFLAIEFKLDEQRRNIEKDQIWRRRFKRWLRRTVGLSKKS